MKLGLTSTDFQLIYEKMYKRVQNYFNSGQHDRIFKGKWYPILLDEDIRSLMGIKEYMCSGFVNRITASVAATLDFSDSWANYYTSSLERVLDIA